MAKAAVITTRIEPGLKEDVNTIFKQLGLSSTEAVTGTDTSWLGCLEDCTEIYGNIVSPVMDENQWKFLEDRSDS